MQTQIEPIKVEVRKEGTGFVMVLRGMDGKDTLVVFRQMWWLSMLLNKLLAANTTPAPAPVKVAVLDHEAATVSA